MIDYYKVYQSIDDTILKNVSEVIIKWKFGTNL